MYRVYGGDGNGRRLEWNKEQYGKEYQHDDLMQSMHGSVVAPEAKMDKNTSTNQSANNGATASSMKHPSKVKQGGPR